MLPNPTFGDGGAVRVDWGAPDQRLAALLPHRRGGAVLVGDVDAGVALAAFDSAGHPDSTYGVLGRMIISIGEGDPVARSAVLDATGRALIATERVTPGGSFPLVLRVGRDGAPDSTFGGDGMVAVPVTTPLDFPHVAVVLLDARGGIVVVSRM